MTHKKSFKRIKKGKNAFFFFKFCHFIKKQKIDLPSKKMTRWRAFIIFFCIVQTTYGQNQGCLGVEITEVLKSGNAKIRIGYCISQQWSAEAISSFHICRLEKNLKERGSSIELSFRHWNRECYKGSYLSFSICSGFRKTTDMKFSLGYTLPIYKGIGMDIGYGVSMLEAIRQKTLGSGEFSMDIHYIF